MSAMLPRDAAPAVVRRLDYRPPAHLVDTVDLKFELAPDATRVTTRFTYRRNVEAQPDEAMVVVRRTPKTACRESKRQEAAR